MTLAIVLGIGVAVAFAALGLLAVVASLMSHPEFPADDHDADPTAWGVREWKRRHFRDAA